MFRSLAPSSSFGTLTLEMLDDDALSLSLIDASPLACEIPSESISHRKERHAELAHERVSAQRTEALKSRTPERQTCRREARKCMHSVRYSGTQVRALELPRLYTTNEAR